MSARRFKHAVVLGSGMAGLVTSRVLADYFEQVTLLERDAAPPDAGPRPGVPQGRHFHALLPGGLLILAELFPGLLQELQAAGSLQWLERLGFERPAQNVVNCDFAYTSVFMQPRSPEGAADNAVIQLVKVRPCQLPVSDM
jgi:2-polyprenyl-6-methoxyphenol hydroxylase-like FAD-dependent oxidoreductase